MFSSQHEFAPIVGFGPEIGGGSFCRPARSCRNAAHKTGQCNPYKNRRITSGKAHLGRLRLKASCASCPKAAASSWAHDASLTGSASAPGFQLRGWSRREIESLQLVRGTINCSRSFSACNRREQPLRSVKGRRDYPATRSALWRCHRPAHRSFATLVLNGSWRRVPRKSDPDRRPHHLDVQCNRHGPISVEIICRSWWRIQCLGPA